MEVNPSYAVQMHGIVKMFGSFCALDHVDSGTNAAASTPSWARTAPARARS